MASSGAAEADPGEREQHDDLHHQRRLASSLTARYSDWVLEALDELPGSFLLTDPALAGHPIVYASRGLAALTGYARREVLGRGARVFQGAATDRAAVAGVREAVRAQRAHQVAILNYRRDGSPHWVLLHLAPVFHARDGSVLHFLAVQVPIDDAGRGAGAPPCRGAQGAVLAACREEARVDEDFPCASYSGKVFVDMDKRGLEAEKPRVASDSEKEKAISTANSIVAALNRYSKLTGLVVSGKRCDSVGIPALSSSLNLSLGRIKQSFVLTHSCLPDMPIIYASDAFLSLTVETSVLGDVIVVSGDRLIDALLVYNQTILMKDGSSFPDLLHVSPIRDASGKYKQDRKFTTDFMPMQVAFHIWVHLDVGAKHDFNGLTPEVWQLGAVGASCGSAAKGMRAQANNRMGHDDTPPAALSRFLARPARAAENFVSPERTHDAAVCTTKPEGRHVASCRSPPPTAVDADCYPPSATRCRSWQGNSLRSSSSSPRSRSPS
ncbi:protein TWIN LOV 1 isoform X2 [Panicum miliaceum]|uniref:Protein TWIN LOV 1 isoform X2 n=1 Tax=Panicum miliaceum TaxID=4540 RepID=A0A3L6QZJ4_PANMI|nr:protein TWIN LOV 1 isoform X2 [Panicum miliaceum]